MQKRINPQIKTLSSNLYLQRNKRGFSFYSINPIRIRNRSHGKDKKYQTSFRSNYQDDNAISPQQSLTTQSKHLKNAPKNKQYTSTTLSPNKSLHRQHDRYRSHYQTILQKKKQLHERTNKSPLNLTLTTSHKTHPSKQLAPNFLPSVGKNKNSCAGLSQCLYSQQLKQFIENKELPNSQTCRNKEKLMTEFFELELMRIIEQESIGLLGLVVEPQSKNGDKESKQVHKEIYRSLQRNKICKANRKFQKKIQRPQNQGNAIKTKQFRKQAIKQMYITALNPQQKDTPSKYMNPIKVKKRENECKRNTFKHKNISIQMQERLRDSSMDGWRTGSRNGESSLLVQQKNFTNYIDNIDI